MSSQNVIGVAHNTGRETRVGGKQTGTHYHVEVMKFAKGMGFTGRSRVVGRGGGSVRCQSC